MKEDERLMESAWLLEISADGSRYAVYRDKDSSGEEERIEGLCAPRNRRGEPLSESRLLAAAAARGIDRVDWREAYRRVRSPEDLILFRQARAAIPPPSRRFMRTPTPADAVTGLKAMRYHAPLEIHLELARLAGARTSRSAAALRPEWLTPQARERFSDQLVRVLNVAEGQGEGEIREALSAAIEDVREIVHAESESLGKWHDAKTPWMGFAVCAYRFFDTLSRYADYIGDWAGVGNAAPSDMLNRMVEDFAARRFEKTLSSGEQARRAEAMIGEVCDRACAAVSRRCGQ